MKQRVVDSWYAPTPNPLLLPLSLLYRGAMILRCNLYKYGIYKTSVFNVPVIIVGNLTVGGSGKTPLVAWLCHYLGSQGLHPGLVSRGYGGQATCKPQPVTVASDPVAVGDEAVMLVQQTACPMWVGQDRVAAARALLEQHACDVIISDDGLQHLALGRTLEILVIDGERGFGNGHCLPAGPLREPLTRLKTVDLQVSTEIPRAGAWCMRLQPAPIYQVINPQHQMQVSDLANKSIHAIAGIGNPHRFFRQLSQLGVVFTPHIFPDHYHYRRSDLEFGPDAIVLMTEKDAVKCRTFGNARHWCLPVRAQLDAGFIAQLAAKLKLDVNSQSQA